MIAKPHTTNDFNECLNSLNLYPSLHTQGGEWTMDKGRKLQIVKFDEDSG